LSEASAQCPKCHTPRNALGAIAPRRSFAGATDRPEGRLVLNNPPDREVGIGHWTGGYLDPLFRQGMHPDRDYVGGDMVEVGQNTTAHLGEPNLQVVIPNLRTRPPISHKVESKKKPS